MNAVAPRRIDVILNHGAGATGKDTVATEVAGYFEARGVDARVVVARTAAELVAATAAAAAGDADTIVAGGGDGTIATVAAPLVDADKTLGVLPLGTFNYFARRLGVPPDLEGALEVIASGQAAAVDVADVNGRIFLNNASIGLYPAVLEQRETTYRKLGRSRAVAYAAVALVLVQPPALLDLRIDVEGARLSRRTPLLFVGTNEYQMAHFGIRGGECIRAGRLAAYITRPLGIGPLWRMAVRAFFRGLYGAREFEIVCAAELRVSLRRRRVRVALDGEVAMLETPLHFRLRRGALRVLAGPHPPDPTS